MLLHYSELKIVKLYQAHRNISKVIFSLNIYYKQMIKKYHLLIFNIMNLSFVLIMDIYFYGVLDI